MKNGVNPLLNQKNDIIFVYGTLKRNSNSEMHRFLAKHADFVDTASFCGKLYKIDGYPGVVPSDDPTDKVYGEFYLIHDADNLFPGLDRYEECGPEFPEPHEYCRRKQKICLGNGGTVMAWVYLYNHSTEGLPLMESADF